MPTGSGVPAVRHADIRVARGAAEPDELAAVVAVLTSAPLADRYGTRPRERGCLRWAPWTAPRRHGRRPCWRTN